MSLICGKDDKGWIIDHEEIIKNIYSAVVVEKSSSGNISYTSFTLDKRLFEIVTPFLYTQEANNASNGKLRRKRKHDECSLLSRVNCNEITIIKSAFKELQSLWSEIGNITYKPSIEDFEKNNEIARQCSASYFDEICQKNVDKFSGGNNSERPILVDIKDNQYLIPNNSEFFCTDISRLITSLPAENQFDFVLMDPPWWNKYIRRRKKNQESAGYKMMYNEEVSALPVGQWLAPGALVAVWCTNCARHVDDVVARWFPRWGLHHVATWYWLKVTRSGELVCQFSLPPGKQPYERILFGAPAGRTAPLPPDNQCIVSVPSAIHSHKPPLVEVVKAFLPQQPRCLELFARYLLPHWTSAGDQVLALQNVKLYTEQQQRTNP